MFRHQSPSVKTPPMAVFRILGAAFLYAFTLRVGVPSARAQAPSIWPPLTPQDLAMKDYPLNPGAPAVILYYEVVTDNTKSIETTYKGIKILRQEGAKYADVEIPYFEKLTQVEEIHARVTSPEGKPEDFSGAIYDKEIVKMKKFRWSAKAFSLPNAAVGSIIEYSYSLHWHDKIPDVFHNPSSYLIDGAMAYPAAEWDIQQALSVRNAHFVLHPIKGARIATYSHELPKDAVKATLPDGSIEIDVRNIPAFEKEAYSPPEEDLKIRADLFYVVGMVGDPSYYWMSLAKWQSRQYEAFMGKPKSVKKETDRILSPADSDETKLKKIYARVQQIRAVSYEPKKSEKERKQESLKENKNAEEVLERGYAFSNEINLVFIALARAAGFQAFPVRLASRNRSFFTVERLNPNQLDALVVEVRSGSSQRFLDPATIYCPYGMLPWEETDAGGIRVDSVEGKVEYTPLPESKEAVTRRQAELNLDGNGNLEGNLTIMYEGQEALSRRIKAIDQDEAQRREDLEEAVRHSLPQNAVVKLLTADSWDASGLPLTAKFQIQISNYAIPAGQRLIVPRSVFRASGKNIFESARRTNPVYLEFPAEVYDDVALALPASFQIESMPANTKLDRGLALFESSVEKQGSTLRFRRAFKMGTYYIQPGKYAALKQFLEQVRADDEQQATLRPQQAEDKKK
jgi:hypothetical protein